MSSQDVAHEYDANSQIYLEINSGQIKDIASFLGVDASAIASGIAREITRSSLWDPNIYLRNFGDSVAGLAEQNVLINSQIINKYNQTIDQLSQDPNALTGQGLTSGNFLLTDLGPGHIRLFTAMQMVNIYADSAIGVNFGFSNYVNNPSGIISALQDQSNPLTLQIEGLVALGAKNFFTSGIGAQFFADGANGTSVPDFNALSQQQRDALTASYSTTGEPYVKLQIENGTYTPFSGNMSPGANYVNFGNNDQILQNALNISLTPSSTTSVDGPITTTTNDWSSPSGGVVNRDIIISNDDGGIYIISKFKNGNMIDPYQQENITFDSGLNISYHTTSNFDASGNIINVIKEVSDFNNNTSQTTTLNFIDGLGFVPVGESSTIPLKFSSSISTNNDGTYTLNTNSDNGTISSVSINIPDPSSLSTTVNGYGWVGADGKNYTISPYNSAASKFIISSNSDMAGVIIDPASISTIGTSASGFNILTNYGVQISWNDATGSGQIQSSTGQVTSMSAMGLVSVDPNLVIISPNADGGMATSYNFSPDGQQISSNVSFIGVSSTGSYSSDSAMASSVQSAESSSITVDTPATSGVNSTLSVALSQLATQQSNNVTGAPGALANNNIFESGGVNVTALEQGSTLLSSVWSDSIANGDYRPGYQTLMPDGSDLTGQAAIFSNLYSPEAVAKVVTDITQNGISLTYLDPLVLDLTGNGVAVSNWIDNAIYFDDGVNPSNPAQADGELHHTSWAKAGTGMLALDPTGGGITNITQMVSEFLNAGPTPGNYTDGLAALAALSQTSATEFTSATALIDPSTGQSYWSEMRVWNDVNQNAVTDAGELQTLAQLGITSISLVGTGNLGSAIDGNPITNSTSYTTSDGSTGSAEAVSFETDALGQISTTASGGIVIRSLTEGGPTQQTTFVAQNASAHTYLISGGQLTDQTTSTVISPTISAALSSSQNDVITVATGDTGTYWLGGGTGADVLTGGGGTNVFLVNPSTVVHGGTGTNSFNIAKVIGDAPVNIDMASDHLQEVVGGGGGDIINASGTSWNVFIQAGSGNSIMIGGAAAAAISGGTGDDLIELGSGGGVVHAGSGNDMIYGASGGFTGASDVIFGGPGNSIVKLGTHNSEVYAGTGNLTVIGNSTAGAFSVVGLHGSYADYTLTHNADGSYAIVDSVAGRDGTVTFSNISALDFSDISQVLLAGAQGMPTDDQLNTGNASQVTINGSGQYVVAAATILANDKDYAGKALSVRQLLTETGGVIARGQSGLVNGGTAALSADGSTITFTPTAGFGGIPSFRYQVEDSSGVNGMSVVQVGTTNTAELTGTVYLNSPAMPSDPLFDKEWFLQAADILPVWQDYTGAGVKVGVFDVSGNVDFSNPDLALNAGSSVKADGTPGVDQIGTHATLVAGIIGASANGAGAVGVAYGATISSEAVGATSPTSIADWQNYDVVNNSFAQPELFEDNYLYNPTFSNAIQNAVDDGRGGLGTVVVFAGGNNRSGGDNTNYHNESNSRYEVVVGGINAPSDLGSLQISGAPFSNPGASILVSAPANNIQSTGVTYTNDYGQTFGADYQTAQGTSFATPIVTGVVALMLQADPNLGYRDVQDILADSATLVSDPSDTTLTYNGATNWNGGGLHTSENYGFGEVNAHDAVRLAETWQEQSTADNEVPLALPPLGETSQTPDAAPLNLALTSFTDPNVVALTVPIPSGSEYALSVEHVEVELDLAGVDPDNLIVQLIAPSGVVSDLVSQPPSTLVQAPSPQNVSFTFDTVRDLGEQTAGNWTVKIGYANGTTPQGVLAGIGFTIYGSEPSGQQTFIYTDEFATIGGSRGTLEDSSGQIDTINLAAVTGAVYLDLAAGSTDSTIDGRSLSIGADTHVDTAFLGDGGGTLVGNNDIDVTGNVLVAGRGAATITGGTGDDAIYAGGALFGNPTSHDILNGGAGNDTFFMGTSTAAVNGGTGSNTLDFGYVQSAVTLNLAAGTGSQAAAGDTFTNIQKVKGTGYDDTFVAGSGQIIDGGSGKDTLSYASEVAGVTVNLPAGTDNLGNTFTNIESVVGSANADTFSLGSFTGSVSGGAGNDTFNVGTGIVAIDGGTGTDTLSYASEAASVTVNLGAGTDSLGDTFTNIESVAGSANADTFNDGSASGTLSGGAGNDTFNLGTGVVTIDGGAGTDTLSYASESASVTVNLGAGTDSLGDTFTNIESVAGSANADTFNDGSASGTLSGGAGNDTFNLGTGVVTIDGGAGTDTLSYASESASVTVNLGAGTDSLGDTFTNIESVAGSANADTFSLGSFTGSVSGGAGNDTFNVGTGIVAIDGGTGTDTLSYASEAASVTVNLGAGTDSLGDSFSNIESVAGSANADTFNDGSASGTLSGGAGNDTFNLGTGVVTIDGGAGTDTLSYASESASVTVNLGAGTDSLGDTFTNIESVVGSANADTFSLGSFTGSVSGGAGNDTFNLGTGVVTIDGGAGTDTLSYASKAASVTVNLGAGTDSLGDTFTNIESVVGSANADTFNDGSASGTLSGGAGNDAFNLGTGVVTIDGGAGTDTLSYASESASVTVNLGAGTDSLGDTFTNIESVVGSANADTFSLGSFTGSVSGGAGNDTFNMGTAAVSVDGGAGTDTLSYASEAAPVTVNLSAHTDNLGDSFTNIESVVGSANADTFSLGSFTGSVSGGAGNDIFNMGTAAVSVDGGAGTDTLSYASEAAPVTINLSAHTDNLGDSFTNIESVVGSAYNDTFTAGTSGATLDGGGGSNSVDYTAEISAVTVNLGAGSDSVGDNFVNISQVSGSIYGDTFNIGSFNGFINGEAGNDIYNMGSGHVTIAGGGGSDTISYAGESASISANVNFHSTTTDNIGNSFSGILYVNGTNFDDTFNMGLGGNGEVSGGAGNDIFNIKSADVETVDGGTGFNTLSYASASSGITVDMIAGIDTFGTSFSNIQNIIGSAHDDIFTTGVSAVPFTFNGGAGFNTLAYGYLTSAATVNLATGTDSLGNTFSNIEKVTGGSGNDTFIAGSSAMTVDGSGGTNTLSYASTSSAVTANFATGTDSIGETLSEIQNVIGSNNSDTFTLGGSVNSVSGGYGYDTYKFNLGSGVQTVINGEAANSGPNGILSLGAGITRANLWLTQSGSDLVLWVLGTSDQLTIKNWFANDYSKVDQLVLSDGSTIFTSAITALTKAMTRYQSEHSGANLTTALATDPGLQAETTAAWAGTVYNVTGTGQTLSASTLGVGAIFDETAGSNTLSTGTSSSAVVIGATNDTLTGSTGTVVADGSNIQITGTPSQVAATNGSGFVLNGGAYTVASNSASITGASSTTSASTVTGNGNTVTLTGANLTVTGSSNTVTLSTASASLSESGSSNNVTITGDSAQITLSGTGSTSHETGNHQSVTAIGSGEHVILAGNNDHATVYAGNSVQISGTNSDLALFGAGLTVQASGDTGTSAYLAPTAVATYTGGGATLNMDAGATATVVGSNDTLNGSSSGGAHATIGKTDGSTFTADTLNLAGTGNVVALLGGVGSTTINGNTGLGLSYTGANSTLNLGSSSVIAATGASNTFNFSSGNISVASGNNNTFNFSGTGNVITLQSSITGSTLNMNSGSGLAYTGSGSTLNVGDSVTASVAGSNNSINGDASGTFTASSGSGNTFNFGYSGGTASVTAVTITLQSGVTGSNINAGDGSKFTYSGSGSNLNLGNTNTVALSGSSNTLNESGASVTISSGASNTFNLGGSSNAVVLQSGVTGTVFNDGASSLTVTGGNATVNMGASETTSITGVGNQVNMTTGDTATVAFGGATGANVVATSGLTAASGTLVLGDSGAAPNDIWFDQSGNDLKLTLMGHSETITIANWFSGATHDVSSLSAGGSSLSHSDVQSLVQAMATFETNYASSHSGAAFNPTASGNSAITDTTVLAAVNSAWHH